MASYSFGCVLVTGIGRGKLPARVTWWHARRCLAARARCWPPRYLPSEALVQPVGENRCPNHEQKEQVEETADDDPLAIRIAIGPCGGEDRVHPHAGIRHGGHPEH